MHDVTSAATGSCRWRIMLARSAAFVTWGWLGESSLQLIVDYIGIMVIAKGGGLTLFRLAFQAVRSRG